MEEVTISLWWLAGAGPPGPWPEPPAPFSVGGRATMSRQRRTKSLARRASSSLAVFLRISLTSRPIRVAWPGRKKSNITNRLGRDQPATSSSVENP